MYVVLFICVCYEIEHVASKQKSLDFFFRKKSENSVEDDVKFVLNNVIKKVVASEDNNLSKIRKITQYTSFELLFVCRIIDVNI